MRVFIPFFNLSLINIDAICILVSPNWRHSIEIVLVSLFSGPILQKKSAKLQYLLKLCDSNNDVLLISLLSIWATQDLFYMIIDIRL
jgi:hypothetical protein